jgi:hypothetical protein
MPGQDSSRASDTELMRAARQGDHAVFGELVCQYDQPVLWLALYLAGPGL